MKKYMTVIALSSSILLLVYKLMRFYWNISLLYGFLPYLLFAAVFLFSIRFLFQKNLKPMTIQLIAILIMFILPNMFRTEINYIMYKKDREELIQLLADGSIKKEPDRSGNPGFFWYYAPPQYEAATKSTRIDASFFSKERYFVFFQSADQRTFDFVGLFEGFVYSSTGKFPTPEEFGYSGKYKKVNDNWYFISDDEQRLKNSCLVLCQ